MSDRQLSLLTWAGSATGYIAGLVVKHDSDAEKDICMEAQSGHGVINLTS